jgi:uncharacterized protein YggT (Ycf19 family)
VPTFGNLADFILNLAGLLVWLNWRSNRFDPLIRRVPATLMGTLRPAEPKNLRRWHFLAFIAALLLLRALIYWWIGRETNWSGKLNLGMTVLWFASGAHGVGLLRMIIFSFMSFGLVLGIFYVFLLPLSLLAGPMPIHGLVTIPLGRVDGWPRWAKAILPFFTTAILWWLASWLLIRLGIITPITMAGRFQQSLLLGISSYLLWKFPLGAILILYLVNSYIYFGRHPFWKYISTTAQRLLGPLKRVPLRIGKVDFAPLIGFALLFGAAHIVENGISLFGYGIPGLVEIFGKLAL